MKVSPRIRPILALWPLLLPIVFFLPSMTGFPYPSPTEIFSDYAISYYANAAYLKETLQTTGQIPFWSDLILSGFPLAANPLAIFWYPLNWIALCLPLPFGHNLMVFLHLIWGGAGMYLFLRRDGLSHLAGLFGALAFASMPKLFAQYGAGHLSFLYAIPWTPWLLWLSGRAFDADTHPNKKQARRWSTVVYALILLADIRWAVYAGLLWFAHSQYLIGGHVRRATPKLAFSAKIAAYFSQIRPFGFQVVVAILLGAPQILPLLEYTRLSARAGMTAADILIFSLPAAKFLGLIFPDFGGNHELMIYVGVVPVILSLVWLFRQAKQPQARFLAWVLCGALVVSLGANLPFARAWVKLPGVSLLRVPSRALFLSGFAFAALSAYGLETLLQAQQALRLRPLLLSLTALSGLTIFLAIGVVLLNQPALEFLWGGVFFSLGAGLVALILRKTISTRVGFIALAVLALLDWGALNRSVLTFQPKTEILTQQSETTQYLEAQTGIFRIYSPSYSLPQQIAVQNNFQLADGVDPLHLAQYSTFMAAASGVPRPAYSVTIPSYSAGAPTSANANFLPDPQLLGLLNVRFVVAEFDQKIAGLTLQAQFGETRVYQNELALPRAWVQPDSGSAQPGAVEIIERQPNRIAMIADGPGVLILSEVIYPGWQAQVDGQPAEIRPYQNLLRSVELSAGSHQIVFQFRSKSIYAGLGLAVIGVTALWSDRKFRQVSS